MWRFDVLIACQAGALLVFASSCLEKLRWLARSEPGADLGQIYPSRRRLPSAASACSAPHTVSFRGRRDGAAPTQAG